MAVDTYVFFFLVIGSLLYIATASMEPFTTETVNTTATTTDKAYTTTPPDEGYIIYEDCVEAQEKTCYDSINRVYHIKARTPKGYAPIPCLDDTVFEGCSGVGWTYVGNVTSNPNSNATAYYSDAWTTKSTSYGFNPAFWSARVSEVCVYSPNIVAIVVPVYAPSLRSLFFGKTLVDMDKSEWEFESTSAVNFTGDCYEVGFNVGDPDFMKLRMGIVAVRNKTGCETVVPNAIGLGILDVNNPIPGSAHGFIANNSEDVSSGITYGIAVRNRRYETTTASPPTTRGTWTTDEPTTDPR